MSPYEEKALSEIYAWKGPKKLWIDKTINIVKWPFSTTNKAILKIPGVPFALEKTLAGVSGSLKNFSHWPVKTTHIYHKYKEAGFVLDTVPDDLFQYDLEELDKVAKYLSAKYNTAAIVEGVAAGLIYPPGIVADVVALIVLSQKVIGEYATYYGFDIRLQSERIYAFDILSYVLSPTELSKKEVLDELEKNSKMIIAKKKWKQWENHTFTNDMKRRCASISGTLTKAKLAGMLPGLGITIGGSFNTYFINKVCRASYFLYRERFLAQKYGAYIIH